jgi:hypothetical protein
MNTTALLEKLNDLGVKATVADDKLVLEPGSRVPPDLVAVLRQHKAWLIIIIRAFTLADKVNDAIGIDSLVGEINRLSWAVQDLQDAEVAGEVWLPLQERCRRLERAYEGTGDNTVSKRYSDDE